MADGKLITSRGPGKINPVSEQPVAWCSPSHVATCSAFPGTAFEFALALVAQLYGTDKASEVARPMVMCVLNYDEKKK